MRLYEIRRYGAACDRGADVRLDAQGRCFSAWRYCATLAEAKAATGKEALRLAGWDALDLLVVEVEQANDKAALIELMNGALPEPTRVGGGAVYQVGPRGGLQPTSEDV